MSPTFDSLAAQALALPSEQRLELAQRLWQSIEETIEDDELFAEIARRDAEMDSKKSQIFSHEEVMRDARKVIGQ